MTTLEGKLLLIKKDLDENIITMNKLEGQLESVENEILELSGCKTIKLAKKECEKKHKLLKSKQDKLNEDIEALEEEYNEISN